MTTQEQQHASHQSRVAVALGTFQHMGDLLHELAQPLTAISNYSHAGILMLESDDSDPEALINLFEQILRQAARSVEINRELRKFIVENV